VDLNSRISVSDGNIEWILLPEEYNLKRAFATYVRMNTINNEQLNQR